MSYPSLYIGIQTIIENTVSAKRIHLIDLEIRCGVQWIVLMQALTDRNTTTSDPITNLRISAVGLDIKSVEKIKETGKRLTAVAESMNLSFEFNLVFIPDTEQIRPEYFCPRHDETVIVYAPLVLRTMLSRPNRLEILMSVVRKLDPTIMVVAEVEANHNSSSFVVRFIESLFFYSAYFDCLEACMDCKEEAMSIEDVLREGIRNIVAAEGEERVVRNVKLEVWKEFFRRFGMVEVGFSESSIYQANLVANEFDGCTVDYSNTCLFIGWKDTPILSLSAWKFR